MSVICSNLFPCQHLKEQDGDGEQDDDDVLLVLPLIFLPVEGLEEEDNEHQEEAHTT